MPTNRLIAMKATQFVAEFGHVPVEARSEGRRRRLQLCFDELTLTVDALRKGREDPYSVAEQVHLMRGPAVFMQATDLADATEKVSDFLRCSVSDAELRLAVDSLLAESEWVLAGLEIELGAR